MKILLCPPTGKHFHDQQAFQIWLWINGVSAWKDISIDYNYIYNFYDVVVDIQEEWRNPLKQTLINIGASFIENFDTPGLIGITPRVRFWINIPKENDHHARVI